MTEQTTVVTPIVNSPKVEKKTAEDKVREALACAGRLLALDKGRVEAACKQVIDIDPKLASRLPKGSWRLRRAFLKRLAIEVGAVKANAPQGELVQRLDLDRGQVEVELKGPGQAQTQNNEIPGMAREQQAAESAKKEGVMDVKWTKEEWESLEWNVFRTEFKKVWSGEGKAPTKKADMLVWLEESGMFRTSEDTQEATEEVAREDVVEEEWTEGQLKAYWWVVAHVTHTAWSEAARRHAMGQEMPRALQEADAALQETMRSKWDERAHQNLKSLAMTYTPKEVEKLDVQEMKNYIFHGGEVPQIVEEEEVTQSKAVLDEAFIQSMKLVVEANIDGESFDFAKVEGEPKEAFCQMGKTLFSMGGEIHRVCAEKKLKVREAEAFCTQMFGRMPVEVIAAVYMVYAAGVDADEWRLNEHRLTGVKAVLAKSVYRTGLCRAAQARLSQADQIWEMGVGLRKVKVDAETMEEVNGPEIDIEDVESPAGNINTPADSGRVEEAAMTKVAKSGLWARLVARVKGALTSLKNAVKDRAGQAKEKTLNGLEGAKAATYGRVKTKVRSIEWSFGLPEAVSKKEIALWTAAALVTLGLLWVTPVLGLLALAAVVIGLGVRVTRHYLTVVELAVASTQE